MEEENSVQLLQRYRRDRRILLDFILSGSLIKKVVMPPGAVTLDDVDLDQVSVDFVLNCAKKGGMLELSDAIRDYHDNTELPHMHNGGSAAEFFLVTNPETSGSPPRRPPPPIPVSTPSHVYTPPPASAPSPLVSFSSVGKSESFNSTEVRELTVDDIDDFEDDEEVESIRVSRRNTISAADIMPKLPTFATGITDDDLRETAYEVLLACAGAAGGLIVPSKEKKKDKRSRLIRKLGRSKSESIVQSDRAPGLNGLLEIMRAQMEISEAMDVRTRQGLLNALSGKVGKRMDTLLVPFELLCCISRTEFSDKKAYIRWQKRQLFILEEGLINHPVVGFGESGRKASDLRILLAKIEEAEFRPSSEGEVQRTECLRSLREVAVALAERPARGDLTGEVCHWADGYHLNVRLYEKLLLSVFDILDEGKLTEEVEEILELLKSTWRVLGLTETIHYTCYSWVLFHQYIITQEHRLLQLAIEQLRKISLKEQRGPQERLHLKSLSSRVEGEDLSFLQSFLSPIQKWADKQLADYHKNFAEDSATMEDVVLVAMVTRRLLLEESDQASVTDREQIESYISTSIKSAFTRTFQAVERLDTMHEHCLALLAEETKKLLRKESTVFTPILSRRHPQAIIISASLLHRLYGIKLKPFLDAAEHLTEDVVSVFPAADSLELYIMSLISSGEGNAEANFRKVTPYQVETISGTLVMRWVNSQLGRILSWVERALQQERWDPISPQQRHGSSIVEVYRIVEETVDQFFALKIPMRPSELNGLFRGIDNAFQVYSNHVIDKLANKEELIPPVPILTRYRKEAGIKAFVKKELFESNKVPEEIKSSEIIVQTTPTLCVQLNTLYYAISQLSKLEDSIWERWTKKKPREQFIRKSMDEKSTSFKQKSTFDGSRKDINGAIDRICEFTGTKIIFWDLKEPFIEHLYKPSVAQSRLEAIIEPLDTELNQLCSIIVEALRDRIVTSLLQASMDGLLRVILDGGSSRVFFPADARLLEEDLEILKEFFISGGDGLPRGVVENHIARIRHVIKLHSYETRELIDDLKCVSGVERQGGGSKLGADTQTLLRILCHRSDSEASQFLKKQFKIPKSSS
ncbi:protein unc-13 homolog [Mercurialis annua]|uniref:protein unc-13 homolog n=1 Tax=Mercurialis annua TaxID=3986 RepID=UPI0021605526|nr:protein unc-13 homolog [Mercurialis annua]XP_050232332.1 protein unc-13 homolog [Mercurialis annua]